MFYLRELERKDLPVINKWRNDAELIALLGAPFRYINLDVDVNWYESYMRNRGNAVRCAITEDGNDTILGLVSLVSVDYMNQSAEFHIMVGDTTNQNRGIGTFAVNTMLEHAFNNMNLQRVELAVLEDNTRAKHLYEKCGFVYEGRKRRARYKNGKFIDILIYSILKPEFRNYAKLGGGADIPAWCVDTTTNLCRISSIIRNCDRAFVNPVAEREIFSDLLQKIHKKGIFIYAHKEQALGYCAFYANNSDNRCAYITLLGVLPEYQNLHIGTQLLNVCMDVAESYGMQSCSLEVKKDNLSAIRFYQANGFVFLSERETSFLMKRELAPQGGKTYEHKGKKGDSSCDGEARL